MNTTMMVLDLGPLVRALSPFVLTSFSIIVFLWPSPAHYIRCNLSNNMSGRYPVGFIDTASDSGSGDAEGTKFIWCVDRRKPQVYEFCIFGEDGVTREVHPKVRVGVGAEFVWRVFYLWPQWKLARDPYARQKSHEWKCQMVGRSWLPQDRWTRLDCQSTGSLSYLVRRRVHHQSKLG